MNKQLLSVLSLSLLVAFAPGCCCKKDEKSKKSVKKIDVYGSVVEENRAWAQADVDNENDEVVTKF